MPGPEPDTLWIEDHGPLGASVSFASYLWTGNKGNRGARAIAILYRLQRRDWHCRWCGVDLPDFKRADATFCRESCRKRAARKRRKQRGQVGKALRVNDPLGP